jgi:hypothetical protein
MKALIARIVRGLIGLPAPARKPGAKTEAPRSQTKTNARPPVCPACRGFGRVMPAFVCCSFPHTGLLACGHSGCLGTCPDCGGAGAIPATIAAIADPQQRAAALAAYGRSAKWN